MDVFMDLQIGSTLGIYEQLDRWGDTGVFELGVSSIKSDINLFKKEC